MERPAYGVQHYSERQARLLQEFLNRNRAHNSYRSCCALVEKALPACVDTAGGSMGAPCVSDMDDVNRAPREQEIRTPSDGRLPRASGRLLCRTGPAEMPQKLHAGHLRSKGAHLDRTGFGGCAEPSVNSRPQQTPHGSGCFVREPTQPLREQKSRATCYEERCRLRGQNNHFRVEQGLLGGTACGVQSWIAGPSLQRRCNMYSARCTTSGAPHHDAANGGNCDGMGPPVNTAPKAMSKLRRAAGQSLWT